MAPAWWFGPAMNQVLAGVNASFLRVDASILQIQLQLMRALNKPVVRPDDELTPLAGVAVAHHSWSIKSNSTHTIVLIS